MTLIQNSDVVEESPRKVTRTAAYLILLATSPIGIIVALLSFFYGLDAWIGFGAWTCLALIVLVGRTRWDLRRHVWFWMIMVFAGLLQIPIVLFVPWKDRNLTWITFLPVAVLDYGLIYGCLKLIEKLTATPTSRCEETSRSE